MRGKEGFSNSGYHLGQSFPSAEEKVLFQTRTEHDVSQNTNLGCERPNNLKLLVK